MKLKQHKKKARIFAHVTEKQKAEIEHIAEVMNLSVSDLIRKSVYFYFDCNEVITKGSEYELLF